MEQQATNPNRRLKIISTFAVGIIGIVLAVVLAKSAKKPESKTPELKLPSVEVQIAEATRHSYRIQSQGTALPRTSIRLVSEVSGKVVSVAESFDVGQIFAKGDVLLKIDSRDYELALTQARSQVAQAQLRLQMEVKEADVVRREWELLNQGEPSGLQAREPQLASALAALEAALAAEEAAASASAVRSAAATSGATPRRADRRVPSRVPSISVRRVQPPPSTEPRGTRAPGMRGLPTTVPPC